MQKFLAIFFYVCVMLHGSSLVLAKEAAQPTVNAALATNLAGNTADIAIPSVFRIIVPSMARIGTGFLHKSGYLITAAHVVSDCPLSEIIILDLAGQKLPISRMIVNKDLDLALLKIEAVSYPRTLNISKENHFQIGAQVSIWGFPEGYSGKAPLILSGYISGLDNDQGKLQEGKMISRWVINSAFNNGNSGSPMIDIQKGEVIGVVVGKLAPLPPTIASALNVLKNQDKGFIYTAQNDQGQTIKLSEAQITEMVLQYLRSQTQLVIGEAVTINNLRMFLKSNNIDP